MTRSHSCSPWLHKSSWSSSPTISASKTSGIHLLVLSTTASLLTQRVLILVLPTCVFYSCFIASGAPQTRYLFTSSRIIFFQYAVFIMSQPHPHWKYAIGFLLLLDKFTTCSTSSSWSLPFTPHIIPWSLPYFLSSSYHWLFAYAFHFGTSVCTTFPIANLTKILLLMEIFAYIPSPSFIRSGPSGPSDKCLWTLYAISLYKYSSYSFISILLVFYWGSFLINIDALRKETKSILIIISSAFTSVPRKSTTSQ